MIGIGLCGMGYRGRNIFRTLSRASFQPAQHRLRCRSSSSLPPAASHPHPKLYGGSMDPIADPQIDAVPRKMTFDFQELPI